MPINYSDAVNEIIKPGFLTWPSLVTAHTVTGSKLYVQGLVEPKTFDADVYFGRISQRTIDRKQKTFRTSTEKRHRTVGALLIQVYAPMSQADNAAFFKGRKLCEALQKVYTDYPKNSAIEFLNVSIEELPNDGKHFRFNVVADYNYDDIG